MVNELFNEVYEKFKLEFYKNIFKGFEDREATLTSTEVFCMEVINALGLPTVTELADFMDISGPNMAYRIAKLTEKGYVIKVQSKDDKREYYLKATDKFYKYYDIRNEYIDLVLHRVSERFSEEDLDTFTKILGVMSNELMPEVTNFMDNIKSKEK